MLGAANVTLVDIDPQALQTHERMCAATAAALKFRIRIHLASGQGPGDRQYPEHAIIVGLSIVMK